MMPLLFLLLVQWSQVQLVNEDFQVPPSDRWEVGDAIAQAGWVQCDFYSPAPDAKVRVVLLTRADWQAWLAGREHDEIDATAFGRRGLLRVAVHEPGTFVVIDNQGRNPAKVHLRVLLERATPGYLSRERQLSVILISAVVFFAIVSLSARKLLRAVGNE